MRIVTFSTSSPTNGKNINMNNPIKLGFSDDKVSLRKLSQVKALTNVQFYQQQKTNHNITQTAHMNSNSKSIKKPQQQRQSHIKWVQDSQNTLNRIKNVHASEIRQNKSQQPVQYDNNKYSKTQQSFRPSEKSKPYKSSGRRKIFQQSSNHNSNQNYYQSKQAIQIPTFSRVPLPQHNNSRVNDYLLSESNDNTKYYSMMMVESPKQKRYQNNSYDSPFVTNLENSKLSSVNRNESQKLQRQQQAIPKLQQKLKQHQQQLSTIKSYLRNSQQLKDLKDSIKQHQTIHTMKLRHEQITNKRLLLINQLQTLKINESKLKKQANEQANQKMKLIQQERIKRLQKIKHENQILKENLKLVEQNGKEKRYYDQQQSGDDYGQEFQDYDQDAFGHQDNKNDNYDFDSKPLHYKFKGPIAFPSKDWDSQRDIIQQQPGHKSFERQNYSYSNMSYQKGYHTGGDMEISPVMKKKINMNDISSINGLSHNKTESFNTMDANTFRDFTSPLDFQGDNLLW